MSNPEPTSAKAETQNGTAHAGGPGRNAQLNSQTPHPAGRVRHGESIQLLRLLLFVLWFLVTSLSMLATQILVSPLYLVKPHYYYTAIANTKQGFGILLTTLTQWWAPTLIRVSGDFSVEGQLIQTSDGKLETKFPERLVFIANHQIYTDWLYLWWIAYTSRMHGYIYIILKDTLKYIPVVGQGMVNYEFIFLSRKWAIDQARITGAMRTLKKRLDPMWLLIFPEGTNLGRNGRSKSASWAEKQGLSDMRHLLLPRSTGLYHCLKELGNSVEWIYDCTIAYEGIPKGGYGEDYFTLRSTYFQGRPPKSVNMYWRRFHISTVPLENADVFHEWLQERWNEKDDLLETYNNTGLFPPNAGTPKNSSRQSKTATKSYIDTSVQLVHWWEVAGIFTPFLTFLLVSNVVRQLWHLFSNMK